MRVRTMRALSRSDFEDVEISENCDRLGTRIARLAVRLGDEWVTLVKTTNVEYIYPPHQQWAP